LIIASLLVIAASPAVAADGGYYNPVHPDVSIYEPGQKAIIAWNGEQEVLILSVDIWAEENNWVLELVPFPSLPTVEAGEFESFYQVDTVLNSRMYSWLDRLAPGKLAGEGENFDILFQENIGAHYITVAFATSAQSLVTFIENLWLTHMGPGEFSWTRLQNLAASYIERDIQYWAIDMLNLNDYLKSREPLVYTFKTDYLYFPLEISSLGTGETRINLYTITLENTDNYPIERAGLSKGSFWVGWEAENRENFPIEFRITQDELGQISSKVAELFDNGAWLTAWYYYGELDGLRGNFVILASTTSETPSAIVQPVGGPSRLPEIALAGLVIVLELEIFVLVWRRK